MQASKQKKEKVTEQGRKMYERKKNDARRKRKMEQGRKM